MDGYQNQPDLKKPFRFLIVLSTIGILLLSGCAQNTGRYDMAQDRAPTGSVELSKIPNAKPKPHAKSRYGNSKSYKVLGKRYYTKKSAKGYVKNGIASWYGAKFHGHRTSSGEPYNMYAMTAAHKTLPLPTYAKVTNLNTGRHIIVKINDRGPFHGNRIIDLSYVAAKKLGITGTGLVRVEAITEFHQKPHFAKNTKQNPKLFLQLGAFSNESYATKFANKLKAATDRDIHLDNKNNTYRVQIGPLASIDESDSLQHILAQHGFGDAFTVIK